MIAPLALAIIATIAGHPAQVVCDVPPTAIVAAWTNPGSSTIHMKEYVCSDLGGKPGDPAFGRALGILIHESAHARGVRSEPCAELWADLVVYSVLERFYRVPMFSELSWLVGRQVYLNTLALPLSYRPQGDSCLYEVHLRT